MAGYFHPFNATAAAAAALPAPTLVPGLVPPLATPPATSVLWEWEKPGEGWVEYDAATREQLQDAFSTESTQFVVLNRGLFLYQPPVYSVRRTGSTLMQLNQATGFSRRVRQRLGSAGVRVDVVCVGLQSMNDNNNEDALVKIAVDYDDHDSR